MADRTCSIEGCEAPHKSRGWCSRHYMSWRRCGDPTPPRITLEHRLEQGFTRDPDTGCWLWGKKAPNGYGYLYDGSRTNWAHRVMYEHLVGPIPDGLHLDHLCRVRNCVNPEHLEPVTNYENHRRGARATQTHCIRGHKLTAENTYVNPDGHRYCRECRKVR